MVLTTRILIDQLSDYRDPSGKIMRMTERGELFPLTRGLYETDKNVPACALACVIYGPSYLSFDYALSYYGLIPESARVYTSATFNKKKKKQYTNIFGRYTYRDVPSMAYPFEILFKSENEYIYQIASPEKALCDKLYSVEPLMNIKEMEEFLFENLRIDEYLFSKLDKNKLCCLSDLYPSNSLKFLKKYIGM